MSLQKEVEDLKKLLRESEFLTDARFLIDYDNKRKELLIEKDRKTGEIITTHRWVEFGEFADIVHRIDRDMKMYKDLRRLKDDLEFGRDMKELARKGKLHIVDE